MPSLAPKGAKRKLQLDKEGADDDLEEEGVDDDDEEIEDDAAAELEMLDQLEKASSASKKKEEAPRQEHREHRRPDQVSDDHGGSLDVVEEQLGSSCRSPRATAVMFHCGSVAHRGVNANPSTT